VPVPVDVLIRTVTMLDPPFNVAVTVASWRIGMPTVVPDTIELALLGVALELIENVAEVAPAGTVIDGGTDNNVLLLASEIVVPPAGAALFSVAVHVPVPPAPKLAGVQLNADTDCEDNKLTANVCETPVRVAVSVTVWLLEMFPAVALKVPVIDPAGTVVDRRTGSSELLLLNPIAVPLEGAAWFSVTVQIVMPCETKLAGLQDSEERDREATKLTVDVCTTPFSEAVSIALWLLGMLLPAVALNVVVAEPAAIVIVGAGTGRNALLLDKETVMPPEGAAWLTVTVQVVLAPPAKVLGLHAREESVTPAGRLIVEVCEMPLSVAVRVAV